MTRRRFLFTCLGLLFIPAVIGWWLTGLSLFVADASKVPQQGALKKLDAIVALTGGSNRLDTAFGLLERQLGKKLFISGVYRRTDVKQLLNLWKSEPQSSLDCCVVLGFDADNTAGNAVETVAWLRKEGYHSLYLVTANYHIKRALMEFHRVAPDLDITPYPVIPDKVDMDNWWKDPVTRYLLLREHMKYVAMYIWHQFLQH